MQFSQALILSIFSLSAASDILMLTPFGTVSHKILFIELTKALGNKGHNVTMISAIKPSEALPNTIEIVLPAVNINVGKDMMEVWLDIATTEQVSYSKMTRKAELARTFCETIFEAKVLQDFLDSGRTFDSVIIDGVMHECLYPVAQLLTKAVVTYNTAALFPWVAAAMYVPTPYSSVPGIFQRSSAKMPFWQRLKNAIILESYQFNLHWQVYPAMDESVRKYFPNAKGVVEALQDTSLVLVNGDAVINFPRPEMPFVVNIGGIHCRPGKPLPKDLADFVDPSEGFILFSLGSVCEEMLSDEHVSIFLKVFSQLKYRVIWKYKFELPNLPKNVKIVSWLPQQDILAHPKIKAFITHAGLLSLQEAFYHNVPTVTLPVFADQPSNSEYLEGRQLSASLHWKTLSVDEVLKAVNRVCEDQELRANVQAISKAFKDVPEPPLEKAIYWLEYVMRHEGAPHLQAEGKRLHIYQYFLLDIAVAVLVVLLATGTLGFITIKYGLGKLFPRKPVRKQKSK